MLLEELAAPSFFLAAGLSGEGNAEVLLAREQETAGAAIGNGLENILNLLYPSRHHTCCSSLPHLQSSYTTC